MNKEFKKFLTRSIIFIVLFIAFSAVIGTKLYSNNLLEGWKLSIYGRIGYILLFSIAGFILVYRERLKKLEESKYSLKDFMLVCVSVALLIGFYLIESNIQNIPFNILNMILLHILGISIFIFLVPGIYGWKFVLTFIRKFRKELGYFAIFGIITYSLMNLIWSLWPYLSDIVLNVTYFLLKLVNSKVTLILPRTLIVNGFGAQIAEACSGIYSIFLFSALYLFAVFLDWKKLNKVKAGVMFIPAVLGAFFVNVLRVFLLMITGGYISREVALGMYHSYTGMIFFLVYFAIFWGLLYKWMKK